MITFSPDLPSGIEWDEVGDKIRNELSYFEGRYVEFPSQLVVRIQDIPFQANGIAEGPDGTPQVQISYDLLSPHTANYQYVGKSLPLALPDEPDA